MKTPNTSNYRNRRVFLRRAAFAISAPFVVPASVLGMANRAAPSNRIGLAILGLGDRGTQHISGFAPLPECQILAVCDVYRSKAEKYRAAVDQRYAQATASDSYMGCTAYTDFREVLGRSDIDAVVITAPENWHGIMASWAAKAGKDVYCEKALTLTVGEGRQLVEVIRNHGSILQVGTQQRSDRNFRHACELARNGYLGNVHTVRVSVPGGRQLPAASPSPVPPDLDYDLWLGPAPWTPYSETKCTYNWYFMADYCAGWIQSWGVHHLDIALWGVPKLAEGILTLKGTGVFPDKGMADTSIQWNVEALAPDGTKLIFTDDSQGKHGCRFEGDEGWVHVVRGGITAEPASLLSQTPRPGELRLPESNHHQVNFLASIRSRRDPVSTVESGHAATTLSLIADIATRSETTLLWDWRKEKFLRNESANRFLKRSFRSPWAM